MHSCNLPSFFRQQRQFSSIQAGEGSKKHVPNDMWHEGEADFLPCFTQGQAPGRTLALCHPCVELRIERQTNAEPHEKEPILDARLRTETGFLQSEIMLG